MTSPDPIQEARERLMPVLHMLLEIPPDFHLTLGLEPIGTAEELAEALSVILSHDEKVKALKEAARVMVEQPSEFEHTATCGECDFCVDRLRAALAALEEQTR